MDTASGPTTAPPGTIPSDRGPRTEAWEAPAPGSWRFDATHCTKPLDRFTQSILIDPYREGFRQGLRLVGAPLDCIEIATVNGWVYGRVKPLGGPEEPSGGPPPKLVLSLLFRLHPELRRRHRTARTILSDRRWVAIVDRWERQTKPGFRTRLDQLAEADVASLADDELVRHLDRVATVAFDAVTNHFANAPVVAMVVGDLLRLASDNGLSGAEAMSTVAGHSSPVTGATDRIDALVAALRADAGLAAVDGPPDSLFDRIRAAGPGSGVELDRYLATVGILLAGGESVADPTVGECPELVQSLLRRRADQRSDRPDPRSEADAAAERLADRLPADLRPRWRQAVADARIAAPVRDDDGLVMVEAMGRARLALLEVGRRLVARGIADRPDAAVELAPDEVGATLAGDGVTARELRRRVALRRAQAELVPPPTLGPEGGPPPLDAFPDAVARVVGAVSAFVDRFDAEGDGPTVDGGGHGVSPGQVTARARLIRHPEEMERMEPGDILVTPTTSPTYNSVLAIAGGVVTATGGSICHAAVMSRELGIPAIVGYGEAMSIPDGAQIRIDGDRGTVEVMD